MKTGKIILVIPDTIGSGDRGGQCGRVISRQCDRGLCVLRRGTEGGREVIRGMRGEGGRKRKRRRRRQEEEEKKKKKKKKKKRRGQGRRRRERR